MKRRLLLYPVVLLLVGYLLTGVTQVRPGERAVVRRFGRVLEQKPEPGLWIGLPWGMDRVDRVPAQEDTGLRPVGRQSLDLGGSPDLLDVVVECVALLVRAQLRRQR